ncbi:hypothetical protein ACHAXT_001311 [Thalassiosira profunda]
MASLAAPSRLLPAQCGRPRPRPRRSLGCGGRGLNDDGARRRLTHQHTVDGHIHPKFCTHGRWSSLPRPSPTPHRPPPSSPRCSFSTTHRVVELQGGLEKSDLLPPLGAGNVADRTRRLLSSDHPRRRNFQRLLDEARSNRKLLQRLQLSPDEAKTMLLLPPDLLRDVHSAILHFSQKSNFGGLNIAAGESVLTSKVPGPMLCARLLELVGIPHYHQQQQSTAASSATNWPHVKIRVHSSQIDAILDVCRAAAVALSRSCEVGRHSLLAANFHFHPRNSTNVGDGNNFGEPAGERKSAARLAEEICRTVNNLEIVYTSGTREGAPREGPWQMRVGRIGSIGMTPGPLEEYLGPAATAIGELEGDGPPWSPKDRRRHDTATMIFNAALAAYAKSAASSSGARLHQRREMLQNAERMLLELASQNQKDPTPATILQCVRPDAVSFNTAIKAWSEFGPRSPPQPEKRGRPSNRVDGECTAALAAERAESILTLMQDLHDEERAAHSTARAAWNDDRWAKEGRAPPVERAIAPVAYNGVIKAWSRSSDPEAPLRALAVYKTMMERSNVACSARESLRGTGRGTGGGAAPEGRTLVFLLQALHTLPAAVGLEDALATVESIHQSAKDLDEQRRWSAEHGLAPSSHREPMLNVFSYNALIKAMSKLPATFEEGLTSCLRIDEIVDDMRQNPSLESEQQNQVLPNAIAAWARIAELAGDDRRRARSCAEKVEPHVDALFDGSRGEGGQRIYAVQAINDAVALYGRAGWPSKAKDLFVRAKACNLSNLGTLSAAIDALCKHGGEDVTLVETAHQHLLEFERDKMRLNGSVVAPDMKYTALYNAVIAGYLAKNKGTEQAEALLRRMIAAHESNPRHIARPNTTSFATVMAALAQRGDSVHKLEELLGTMERLHGRRVRVPPTAPEAKLLANVAPNIVVYNLLLKAYARTNDVQSAMKLVHRIEKDSTIQLDEVSNSYLVGLMAGQNQSDPDGPAGKAPSDSLAISPLNLNDQKLAVPVKSFDSIMNTYATTGTAEGAEKGAALMRKLEAMYASGELDAKPDVFFYNKLMNAWQLCEQNNKDQSICPSEKAEEILDSLCEQYEDGVEGAVQQNQVLPNDVSFSICIHAWCKSDRPDAAERAERLLRRKEVFANKYRNIAVKASDFNPIISKWKGDPERATLLFDEMVVRYADSEKWIRPTAGTLNSLLSVYGKYEDKNLAPKAENLLHRTNQLHKDGKGCILPDMVSYRTVIDAWIRQWHKDGPQRVDALVQDMAEKYEAEGRTDLRPDENALNLILKACAQAPPMWKRQGAAEKGDNHPIAIANKTFAALKGKKFGASATHATYSFMFKVYRQHMDFHDERYAPLMLNLWRSCVRDGNLSQFTLRAFRDSVLEKDFWAAVGGDDLRKSGTDKLSVKDLPNQWGRNVISLKDRGKKTVATS